MNTLHKIGRLTYSTPVPRRDQLVSSHDLPLGYCRSTTSSNTLEEVMISNSMNFGLQKAQGGKKKKGLLLVRWP
jgi:hypothetical protein